MNRVNLSLAALTLVASGLSGAVLAGDHGSRHLIQHRGHVLERQAHTCHVIPGGRSVDARQDRQEARIRHGVHARQLTHGEARRLTAEQRRIARMEHGFRADGHLTAGERRRLKKAQDRARDHIWQAKHNAIQRHGHDRAHRDRSRGLRLGHRDD